jgi:hypothetical protein
VRKYDLYEAIARNIGDLVAKDTPSAATATTVDADSLIHPETGQLKGYQFYIYDGAGAGQTRIITDFLPDNNRLVVDRAFTTTPSINSNFYIFKSIKKEDLDNFVDRAMGLARQVHLDDYCPTMELVATQYEYTVPSGIAFISHLQLVPSGHTDYEADDEVDRVFMLYPPVWRVENNIIMFDPRRISLDNFDEELIRVVGQARPATLGTDNATVPVDLEDYLIARSTQLAVMPKLRHGQEWMTILAGYKDLADKLEGYIRTQQRGQGVEWS